ncbi:MAG: ABC transporter permease [Spirochaetaceae bacterium]|jgi:simple sugar transport system permease protein|nr:ABC transporter permease [Spirochaetaceae bacterium]
MPEVLPSSNPEKNAPSRFQQGLGRALAALGGTSSGMALILLISLGAAALLIFLLSAEPAKTLGLFFLGPLRNRYYLGNMLNSGVPLIFGGLGVSVALQGGNYNLGGEGQIYGGAFVSTLCALALAPLGWVGAAAALLAGSCAAGLVAAFSGFCRVRWNTNELITSFLVSNMLILAVNYLITGPFLDPETNLQSTRKIPESFRLPRILPPSSLSTALFLALLAALAVWFFLYRTRPGYEIRITGYNAMFVRYGGVSESLTRILAMFLSGALCGLGGGLAVYGTYYAAMKEFSAGLGWNSIAVALIARAKPALVIPSALFFAWIGAGARMAMQFSGVTVEIASIVQATVFFLVTSAVLLNFRAAPKPGRNTKPRAGRKPGPGAFRRGGGL